MAGLGSPFVQTMGDSFRAGLMISPLCLLIHGADAAAEKGAMDGCYYMAWKEVADTLRSPNRLTSSRRLIHEFSLSTGISNPWTSTDFHRAPGSLVYKDNDSPLDSLIDFFRFTLATMDNTEELESRREREGDTLCHVDSLLGL